MIKRILVSVALAVALVAPLPMMVACGQHMPAELAPNPTVEQVAEARHRAVQAATAITASLTIATQALDVADELEKSNLLRPQVLREMTVQGDKLAAASKATLGVLERIAGGSSVDLRTTLQVVLGEFETMLKLFDATTNATLKQLAIAARAVLAIITVRGV